MEVKSVSQKEAGKAKTNSGAAELEYQEEIKSSSTTLNPANLNPLAEFFEVPV
jgi:hypothetical protein